MASLHEYISKLMTDDKALKDFLIDPIKSAEKDHGLSKAERTVLRRTVHHLSNASKNGYAVSRDMGSYRRSLRLLQNVLHGATAKELADHSETANQHYIVVYYNGLPGNYTGQGNTAVGSPYANYIYGLGTGSTIGEVVSNANVYGSSTPMSSVLKASNSGHASVVTEVEIPAGFTGSGTYSAYPVGLPDPDTGNLPDFVFWFYSINGAPMPHNQHNYGSEGQSYYDYPLNPGDYVVWQLIAPDVASGFQPCPPPSANIVTAD